MGNPGIKGQKGQKGKVFKEKNFKMKKFPDTTIEKFDLTLCTVSAVYT